MITAVRFNIFKLFILGAVVFLSLLITGRVFAQSASPKASPSTSPAPAAADFKYPVSDLGGCKDLESCTNYCEDPVNYNACSSFAKKNGFYKDDETLYADDKFWSDAKKELSCNSQQTCSDFCSKSENFEACNSFAKRSEIPGGYTDDPGKSQYVEAAKTTLGCDSASSCTTFCDNPANAKSCSDFANKVGLEGGTTTQGPGGCQSSGTCGSFCSDPANFAECSKFQGGNFQGPGGCTSEGICQSYCEKNPGQCRSYEPGSNGVYVSVVCPQGQFHGPGGVCTPVADTSKAASCAGADKYWDGSNCQNSPPPGISTDVTTAFFEPRADMGDCKTPGECYDYCKANPGKCAGFDVSGSRPTDNYTPYLYYTPGSEVKTEPVKEMGNCDSPAACYDYCKANPGKCQGFSDKAPRPPEVYIPGTYYTPPTNTAYVTPPTTFFYTTPIYPTPPKDSTYTTPQYYTPGTYSTPTYHFIASDPIYGVYTTPNYYTPWNNYSTPTGNYPTPTYSTPTYYTPPAGSNYTTPYYYTPPTYTTPYYYTPGQGGVASNYTTPNYITPPPYTTPQYYTPYGGRDYTTPVYYTPITYSTPYYPTPPKDSNYVTPNYYTPPINYTTPRYYTPGEYPTPPAYITPPPYVTPSGGCPPGAICNYSTPAPYGTPTYNTPPIYTSPSGCSGGFCSYPTPPQYTSPYSYPTPGGPYTYPTPSSGGGPYYSPGGYPSPYSTPSGSGGGPYYTPTPSYGYPTPGGTYGTPNYPSPTGSYSTPPPYGTPGTTPENYPAPPAYGTPSYATPPPYGTPSYGTPPPYGTPTYETPPPYGTPSYATPAEPAPPPVQGVSTSRTPSLFETLWNFLSGK